MPLAAGTLLGPYEILALLGSGGMGEISVRRFGDTTARCQISRGGGRQPLWRPDGKQLFYISPDKKIIAVDVNTTGRTFAAGATRAISGTRIGGWESTNQATPYAVTSDGKRFLINNAAEVTYPIHVMLHWSQMFR